MDFELDAAFMTSVSVRKEWSIHSDKKTLTDEELLSVVRGSDRCCSFSSDDLPEFNKLRLRLGELGFIEVWHGSWNADCVLKTFTLNGVRFVPGETFFCGAAIAQTVKQKQGK